MRGKQRWAAAERAELVAEYLLIKHGQKGPWLAERGINPRAMASWRTAFFFGDLERELVPRDTSLMSPSDGVRMKQLEAVLRQEREARAADQARHAKEVDRLSQANEALGKAIGLLHDHVVKREPTDASSPKSTRRTTTRSS